MKGHAQQHLGGQAPDQASDSNRDRGRRPTSGQVTARALKPVKHGVTLAVTGTSPARSSDRKRDPHSQV